jgi:GNAT superfamily N-acetyltransferase
LETRALSLADVRTVLSIQKEAYPPVLHCVYILDIAVSPACRGRGVARLLLSHVFNIGNRLELGTYTLTAVQSYEPFWSRLSPFEKKWHRQECLCYQRQCHWP